MATPRIFISSTCYDLQEIRFQLRRFIEDIGYEPVMSEFGDIFYDLGQHVQDACKEEISRSNVFILVVGNNYGSIYHKPSEGSQVPDSVTLQEFRKALAVGVPKYIFINRFVQHDFENYSRALSKNIAKYFSSNDVADENVHKMKNSLKKNFDNNYPFPQEAYRYVFYFLDEIYNLDTNNAVYPFESFDNIKESLRKQWAGFFYEALTKEQTVSIDKVDKLERRLGKIEYQLKLLSDGITSRNENNTISIDIASLAKELNIDNLSEIQNRIDNILYKILYDENDEEYVYQLLKFTQIVTPEKASEWIKHIGQIIKEYKWSKYISASDVFSDFSFEFVHGSYNLTHKLLFELFSISSSLSQEDREALAKTIAAKFNDIYEKQPPEPFNLPDDAPF